MIHYLPLLSTADHILTVVKAHAEHSVERLVGYVLVATTLDAEGRLRVIAVKPDDQDEPTTDGLLAEGRDLLRTE